jgi:hypothetical protein
MAESVTAEVKENPSLRARAKARVDKPEQPSAEKQKKSKNSENAATDDEQLGRLQPACLGIGVAVVLASIILYLATPPGPMKPVCIRDSLPSKIFNLHTVMLLTMSLDVSSLGKFSGFVPKQNRYVQTEDCVCFVFSENLDSRGASQIQWIQP